MYVCINYKWKNLLRLAQLSLLYMVESIMLHVSTLHLGHLQALTKNLTKNWVLNSLLNSLLKPEDDPNAGSKHVA